MIASSRFWRNRKGVVGKYHDVYLQRHIFGWWRIVKTTKNSFPVPEPKRFYVFNKGQAEGLYREFSWHAASGMASCHESPDRSYIEKNKEVEPEGERIRAEMEDFIFRNKISGMYLDTDKHTVDIQIAKLPPRIMSVLTKWGSIYVVDEREG